MRAILILLCLTLIVGVSQAQSSKKKKKRPVNVDKRTSSLERHASSLEPYTPYSERATSRKKSPKQKDKNIAKSSDPVQEFYARMAEVQKKREKTEKMMEKPQYSDPMYFGHRRPPKKRSPDKMKYCKECGIKH